MAQSQKEGADCPKQEGEKEENREDESEARVSEGKEVKEERNK